MPDGRGELKWLCIVTRFVMLYNRVQVAKEDCLNRMIFFFLWAEPSSEMTQDGRTETSDII